MRKIFIYVIIAFGVLFSNCEKDKNVTPGDIHVDNTIIVDSALYSNAPNDEFEYSNAEIIGDSLTLTIRYEGGCEEVKLKLIDSEDIMESIPVQRNIRLSLNDNDPCETIITKIISFDLTPIKLSDQNSIKLNLAGWDSQLLYEY